MDDSHDEQGDCCSSVTPMSECMDDSVYSIAPIMPKQKSNLATMAMG